MPELPEVESLRRYLVGNGMIGATFDRITLEDKPSPNKGTGSISGIEKVEGRTVRSVERRGKQLAAVLDDGVLGLHMGMTGQVNILDRDEQPGRFSRALFESNSGFRMSLEDYRRWASLRYFESTDEAFEGLGPDALESSITPAEFAEVIGDRKAQIKPLLLNQSVIAGVGNIYADEALHKIKVSPTRKAHRISKTKRIALLPAIHESLEHALEFILSNPDDRGRPYIVDAYDDRMKLHRKPWSFCPRCEIPLKTVKFRTRTSYFCWNCQK